MSEGAESRASSLSLPKFVPVVAVGAVVFYSITGGFVFDERILIQGNPAVTNFDLGAILLHKFWPGPVMGVYYRPVTTLSYALCYALAGDAPWNYHLFNVLVHAIASVLVVFLAWRIFNHKRAALITGGIFAVHPVHVESVAWVPGRTDLLAAVFLFSSWLLILRARESGKWRVVLYVLSMAAFIPALGGKESAAVLPLLVMAYDCFIGRGVRAHWRDYAVMFVLLAGWMVLRHFALAGPGEAPAPDPLAALDLLTRVLYIAAIPAYALFVIVYPYPWRIDYAYEDRLLSMPLWEVSALAAITAALVIVALAYRKRAPFASLCAGGFLLSMIPMSHLIPFPTLFAERFLYIPSVFFALFIGLMAKNILPDNKVTRPVFSKHIIFALVIFFLILWLMGLLTTEKSKNFTGSLSFWNSAVRQVPENAAARNWLGIAYKERLMLEKAADQYRAAYRLDPGLYIARMNLAGVLLKQGEPQKAIGILAKLEKEHPSDSRITFNLGSAYAANGQWKKAETQWLKTLELDPGNLDARHALERVRAKP